MGKRESGKAGRCLLMQCSDGNMRDARLTWSVAVLVMVLLVSNTVSGGNGDSDGEGCSRGLAGTDGDGLGVRNDTGGDRIPVRQKRNGRR